MKPEPVSIQHNLINLQLQNQKINFNVDGTQTKRTGNAHRPLREAPVMLHRIIILSLQPQRHATGIPHFRDSTTDLFNPRSSSSCRGPKIFRAPQKHLLASHPPGKAHNPQLRAPLPTISRAHNNLISQEPYPQQAPVIIIHSPQSPFTAHATFSPTNPPTPSPLPVHIFFLLLVTPSSAPRCSRRSNPRINMNCHPLGSTSTNTWHLRHARGSTNSIQPPPKAISRARGKGPELIIA